MAHMKVELPFGRTIEIDVCEICGSIDDAQCIKTPVLENPDRKLLDVVMIFRPPSANAKDQSLIMEWHTVSRLFYSEPGQSLLDCYIWVLRWALREHRALPLHTLCIELARGFDSLGNYHPWHPDSSTRSSFVITYTEFLLLQEGDRKKMEAAGLIKPAKKSFLQKICG